MTPLVSQLWPQFMADPDFAACFGRVVVEHAQMLRQERQVIFTLRSSAPLDKGLCARLLASLAPDYEGFELRIRNMDAFYFLAAAAIQLLMILLRALKTVCFAGDGNTPHFANINQRIQVAVNGAKAQPRAHCPQRRTDLLRGWIIVARKYLPQNQFTLMRIAHTKNLLLIQCRGKNSKYFPLHIVYMIPVPYHIK